MTVLLSIPMSFGVFLNIHDYFFDTLGKILSHTTLKSRFKFLPPTVVHLNDILFLPFVVSLYLSRFSFTK